VSVDRRQVLGLLGGGLVAGLVATPARADANLDLRILQTASSLEVLAEAAWARVSAGPLAGFAPDAARRHAGHAQSLQARTAALGGRRQDAANPKFRPLLAGADPVVTAATVEKVLVDTYLGNLPALDDRQAKELVAGAMMVAAQHLAVLRVAGAGPPELVRMPFRPADMARLPATAGSGATPDALHQAGGPELVAEPTSGALG
jgi:hypothetical protein